MTLKGERVSPVRSMFQVEGRASEKDLRVKHTYCAPRTTKRLVWLEKRKKGTEKQQGGKREILKSA